MSCGRKQPQGEMPGFVKGPAPPPPPPPSQPAGGTLVQLTCSGCGWIVIGLMGGANGTNVEQARRDLVRALHWSHDGKRCGYCCTARQAPPGGCQQKEAAHVSEAG